MRMGKKLQIKYKIQVMATVLIIPPVVRPENVAYVRTDTDGTDVQPISPANLLGPDIVVPLKVAGLGILRSVTKIRPKFVYIN